MTCLHVCRYVYYISSSAADNQKKTLNPLELELQTILQL